MFEQYVNSSDPQISTRAQQLQNYTNQYQSGQLSKSEYTELCQDLCDLSQIDDLASTAEEKAELQQTFEQWLSIIEAVALV